MLTKHLYALLLGSLLFTACKKEDSAPDNTFIINGVRDVVFTSTGTDYLDLTVAHISGSQERVTISVSGVPDGVTATVVPASGTPDFTSTIRFTFSGGTAEGTFPIRIVGTAASYTKSYDLNLVLPPFSGLIVNGVHYRAGSTLRNVSDFYIGSYDHNGANLICTVSNTLPDADGVYTYKLDEDASVSNSMQLTYFETSPNYYLNGSSGKTATVTIIGGRMSLSIPTVTLYSYTGDQKEVSATASQ